MAKKQFTTSFNDIFAPSVEQPMAANESTSNSDVEVTSNEIQRTTILLNRETYETIKAIAHWERCQIKDLIDNALRAIIDKYTNEELARFRIEFSQRHGSR